MAEHQPLAVLGDFEARHGTVPPGQVDVVTELLDDASAVVLDEAEDSDAGWVAGEDDAPRSIVSIVVSVAYRAWSNPDALAQASMGDTSISYTRGGTPDAVFLTEAEKRRVRRAARRSTFRSVTLVSPYSTHGTPFNPLGED